MTAYSKAIALLSGGLDSTLAVRLLLDQGIEILAVNFTSPFCTCSPRRQAGCHMAGQVARDLGVDIRVLPKGMEYLRIVERPLHGRGRGLNPCIDCRIFMLKKVRELMPQVGARFVVTGEVLGQRPMSQHRAAMRTIERESGLEGLLLRPLCAGHLEPTLPERRGWVDRQRLLAIQGRSRRPQLDMAAQKGIDRFSCAAGGCLLTDPHVSRILQDLFDHTPNYDWDDVRLVTTGRHFRPSGDLRFVLGRNQSENERLAALCPQGPLLELDGPPGPTLLARGELDPAARQLAGQLLRTYAPKAGGPTQRVKSMRAGRTETFEVDAGLDREEAGRLRI